MGRDGRAQFLFKSDDLAYWYLRLNGFMTIQNFILHDDSAAQPRTDADIFGVRFPFRQEPGFEDDIPFQEQLSKPYFVIAEIKRSECKLNGPWTDRSKENMQYLLKSIGAFEECRVEAIAQSLYERFAFEDATCRIEMVAIGARANPEFKPPNPSPAQWLFKSMLKFVHRRMSGYAFRKKEHQNWDEAGKSLYKLALATDGEDDFANLVIASTL
jgi:hypothetical protein